MPGPPPASGKHARQHGGLIETAPAQTCQIERHRDDEVVVERQRAVVCEEGAEYGRQRDVALIFESMQGFDQRAALASSVEGARSGAVEMRRASEAAATPVIRPGARKALATRRAQR